MDNTYLADIANTFQSELKHIQTKITKHNTTNNPLLENIITYTFSSGGKKIRPLLTMLIAKIIQPKKNISSQVQNLATAVELIHTATLLHDDVIDNSSERRKKLSANFIWGNKTSILAGDYIFSQSFIFMVLINNFDILEILANTSAEIANAEVMQLSLINNYNITKVEYIELIKGKTANLFAAACKCSAIAVDSSKNYVLSAYQFGLNLGILFQLCDDYRDYFCDADTLGKTPGGDFAEGKITLPLIVFFDVAEMQDKQIMKKFFKENCNFHSDFNHAKQLIMKYNVKKLLKKFIKDQAEKTMQCLTIFPNSMYTNQLKNLVSALSDQK